MNKRFYLSIIGALLLLAPGTASLQGGPSPRLLVLDTLKRYSPTGYHIVTAYGGAPEEITMAGSRLRMSKTDFMAYVRGAAMPEMASWLNVTVHEMCHGYTARMAYHLAPERKIAVYPGDRYLAFYIGGDEDILVRITRVFPSREIARDFPAGIRTFRFATYVDSPRSNMGTQVNGVYGLLDELNAYYHGTRTALDLLPFYKKQSRQDAQLWRAFFNQVNGTYYAHLEFKLFILKYLIYAEKTHPGIYRDIMDNEGFRKAFATIDKNFTALNEEYSRSKTDIFGFLKTKGIEAREEGKYLYFKSGNTTMGLGNFTDTRDLLARELEKTEYRDMLARLAAHQDEGH
ncbi:MAG: hypothetical protein JW838_14765 [Spirochaetes bacterium]|nr:hypothetical protein [Spirochaetota bacterium]